MQKMRFRILFGFANFLLSVNPTAYAHGRKSLLIMLEHKIIQNKMVSILFKCSSSYCFVVLIRMCFIVFVQLKMGVWMLLKKLGENLVEVLPDGDCWDLSMRCSLVLPARLVSRPVVLDDSPADDCEGAKFRHKFFVTKKDSTLCTVLECSD